MEAIKMKKTLLFATCIFLIIMSFVFYSVKQNKVSDKLLVNNAPLPEQAQSTASPGNVSNITDNKIQEEEDDLINIAIDTNVHNGGYVHVEDDATYLSLDQAILKLDDSSSVPTKLVNAVSKYVTLSKEGIFYTSLSNRGGIYRMKRDGSENIEWLDKNCEALYALDGALYYINKEENNAIYRYSNDGMNYDKLNNEFSASLTVTSEGIYYAGASGFLTKINLDGSSKQVLNKTAVSFINVTEKYIYFINPNDKKIYKVQKDDGKQFLVSDDNADSMNISDGWIYYTKNGIFKEKSDGSEKTLVLDYDARNISITSRWIYYTNSTMNQTFRVAKEGGEPEEITLEGRHLAVNHFEPAVVTDEAKEAGKEIVKENLKNSTVDKERGYVEGITFIEFNHVDEDGRFVYQVYNVSDNHSNTVNWYYVNVATGTYNTRY